MAKIKRFLASLLSVIMLLQMMPVSAIAEGVFYSNVEKGADYYKVVFQDKDGTLVTTQYVMGGETLILPEDLSKEQHKFLGWYVGDEQVTADTAVTADMTVTARFEEIALYTVHVKYVLENDENEEVADPVTRSYTADDAADSITSPASVLYGEQLLYPDQAVVDVDPSTLSQTETTILVHYAVADATYSVAHYALRMVTGENGEVSFTKDDATLLQTQEGFAGTVGSKVFPEPLPIEHYEFAEAEELTLAAENNVAKVYYRPLLYTLTYNTQGGSYVEPKTGYYNTEVAVYSVSEESEFTCTKVEHTHTAQPTYDGSWGDKSGCWSWKWTSSGIFQGYWSWQLSCGLNEHKHSDDCNTTYSTITPVATRQGYEFTGWYLDPNCTNKADSSIVLRGDTTVYAGWKAGTADYTVVYLVENVEGGWNYLGSKVKTGTVGQTVSGSGDYGDFTNSDYYEFDSDSGSSAVVKADNSTVVNAYYKLKDYTLRFNFGRDGNNASLTINGKTYGSGEYTIQAKLGEDIADRWPTAEHISGGRYSFYGWEREGESSIYVSKRFNLTTNMLHDPADKVTEYTAQWTNGTTVYLHYMLQNADDDGYTDSPKYYQAAVEEIGSEYSAKQIDGFTHYDALDYTSNENRYKHYYFHYNRNTYSIDYYYGSQKLNTINNVRFEKNITSNTYNWTPTTSQAGVDAEYTFKGWYVDPECTEAYVFDKMPASNLVLYAKFEAPDRYVTLNYQDDATQDDSITVKKGSTVEGLPQPEREGYTFLGWFTSPADGTRFDENMPIEQNITVYAHWKLNTLSYTVQYLESGTEKELAPEKRVANSNYVIGQQITEQSVTVQGYRADAVEKSISLGVNAAQNVITFYYKTRTTSTYTVNYVIQGTLEAVVSQKQEIVSADVERVTEVAPAPVTHNGVVYYPTVAVQSLVLTTEAANNTLTFEYLPYKTAVVQVEFYYGSGSDYSSYSMGGKATETVRVGGSVYSNTYNTAEYNKNGQFKLVNADPANITITTDDAGQTLTMKLYFERNAFTVTYQPGEHGTLAGADDTGNVVHTNVQYGTDTPDAPVVTAAEGYYFAGWEPTVAATVTADATYVAQYQPKGILSVTVKDKTVTYNGQEQEGYTIPATTGNANNDAYTVSGLKEGHQIQLAYQPAKGTDVAAEPYTGSFTGNAKVVDAQGQDVTNQYSITLDAGDLKIDPVDDVIVVKIKGATDTKEYTGKPQFVTGYEVTSITGDTSGTFTKEMVKLVEGEEAKAEGTQVDTYYMGLTKDSFTWTDNETYPNVSFEVEDGWLKIDPVDDAIVVKIKGATDTKEYTGKPQFVTGYEVTSITGDTSGHSRKKW